MNVYKPARKQTSRMESPEICRGGEKLRARETDHGQVRQRCAATVAEL